MPEWMRRLSPPNEDLIIWHDEHVDHAGVPRTRETLRPRFFGTTSGSRYLHVMRTVTKARLRAGRIVPEITGVNDGVVRVKIYLALPHPKRWETSRPLYTYYALRLSDCAWGVFDEGDPTIEAELAMRQLAEV